MKTDNSEALLTGISIPRNARQITNMQSRCRKYGKICHDSLYGLHLLVDHLDNYVLSIKTTPDMELLSAAMKYLKSLNGPYCIKMRLSVYITINILYRRFLRFNIVLSAFNVQRKTSYPYRFHDSRKKISKMSRTVSRFNQNKNSKGKLKTCMRYN